MFNKVSDGAHEVSALSQRLVPSLSLRRNNGVRALHMAMLVSSKYSWVLGAKFAFVVSTWAVGGWHFAVQVLARVLGRL
jgi:hypothetical protein